MRYFIVILLATGTTAWAEQPVFPADVLFYHPPLSKAGLEKQTFLAEKGDTPAQAKLCEHYMYPAEGAQHQKNHISSAQRWCVEAAKKGNVGAMAGAAQSFGEMENYTEAYFWYALAYRFGDKSEIAEISLKNARKHLSEEKLAELDKRVLAWAPAIKH